METYTLEQIKQAYWNVFHEAGEVWFSYLGSKKNNENSTEIEWKEFIKALEKTHG